MADPVHLRQCLLLLLNNAEKYAPEGTITITTRRDGTHGVIGIADEGPGIPPARRDLALKPYYRLPATRDLPGSGLGLHIAETLMTTMNGRIELADAPSGGLKVSLWLPLATAGKAEEPPGQGAETRGQGSGTTGQGGETRGPGGEGRDRRRVVAGNGGRPAELRISGPSARPSGP
ncbi:sensor histidine kinase [Actinomadura madurae]|uniref:sensor histidine kinase n=1 Tax=Actinomadura madurae TaxID=1993 RepID=UPI0035582DD8